MKYIKRIVEHLAGNPLVRASMSPREATSTIPAFQDTMRGQDKVQRNEILALSALH